MEFHKRKKKTANFCLKKRKSIRHQELPGAEEPKKKGKTNQPHKEPIVERERRRSVKEKKKGGTPSARKKKNERGICQGVACRGPR